MRLLFGQNVPYYPSFAGATQSDRVVLADLAARGHQCRVVARIPGGSSTSLDDYVRLLSIDGLDPQTPAPGCVAFMLDGVQVHAVRDAQLRRHAAAQLAAFRPDVAVVSTDPLNALVDDFTKGSGPPVVYVARTTTLLPFGPDAAFPSRVRTEAIRRAAGVVAVSRYLAGYIAEHAGIQATYLPLHMSRREEWPVVGDIDNTFVTMINPCALKGITIFTALADACPDLRFAAVPTWGTTAADRAALGARPNVTVLDAREDICDILRQTRVTLVPSLWAEARGRIVIESMLSGVPVLASDIGGIREVALDVPCLLPVNPIVRYRRCVDELGIRVPEMPAQDVRPWRDALLRLLSDRQHYAALAALSRESAMRYVSGLDAMAFDSFLAERRDR